jgi:lipid II:glycine glycyltransferase (peptidoglycan interpeptide bridge formation enzyme)
LNNSDWDSYLAKYPDAHLLQNASWGELKNAFGWQVDRFVVHNGNQDLGAQILVRQLSGLFRFAYLAKGPVDFQPEDLNDPQKAEAWQELWQNIDAYCRSKRVVFLKLEPDWLRGSGEEPPAGFRGSSHPIQPLRTILVDLTGDEEQILSRMKQKTRYNIRLADRKGVVVNATNDISLYYQIMQTTGERAEFGIHSRDYYEKVFDLFSANGRCVLLLAEIAGEPLAAIMLFISGKRAWYFYGASTDHYREFMPTYLLQWEAMRWARSHGCQIYDFWGVPDFEESDLENNFLTRSDGLWGVYRFKRGFGGQVVRYAGPYDRVYQPVLYKLYQWWVSRRQAAMGVSG